MINLSCYPDVVPQLPRDWSGGIDTLVDAANALLPALLPAERFGRQKEEINARLVRHYTTTGHLPPPGRSGREAQYSRRHLLALLALRRLMADGISGAMLHGLVAGQAEDMLEQAALRGFDGISDVNRHLPNAQRQDEPLLPPSPEGVFRPEDGRERERVVSFLRGLQRSEPPQAPETMSPPRGPRGRSECRASEDRGNVEVEQVRRIRPLPGVEILIDGDVRWPSGEAGWAEVLRVIEVSLRDSARR